MGLYRIGLSKIFLQLSKLLFFKVFRKLEVIVNFYYFNKSSNLIECNFLVMEITDLKHRSFYGIFYQMFFVFGYILQTLLAYYWRNWHYLMVKNNI